MWQQRTQNGITGAHPHLPLTTPWYIYVWALVKSASCVADNTCWDPGTKTQKTNGTWIILPSAKSTSLNDQILLNTYYDMCWLYVAYVCVCTHGVLYILYMSTKQLLCLWDTRGTRKERGLIPESFQGTITYQKLVSKWVDSGLPISADFLFKKIFLKFLCERLGVRVHAYF